jgi:cytoskeletal protein CcmA (bactofilin family)
VVLIVAASASAALAQATQLGGKLRAGEQILIAEGEVVEGDLYVSAGTVRVAGTVTGDLLVWGGQVDVTGRVDGDLMAAAGQVDVAGEVGGDVRAAGGQLAFPGTIGEDLFVGGARVILSGEVGEDLVFGTGQMVVSGAVGGDVLGSAGAYTRSGTVGGTENVTIVEQEEHEPTAADRGVGALQRYLSILALAALALWFAPRVLTDPVRTLRQRPFLGLGVGLLALVGIPLAVAVLLLVAGLVAIILAFLGLGDLVAAIVFAVVVMLVVLGFVLFLAVGFGAPAIVGMALGDLVIGATVTGRRWWSLIFGLLVVVAASSLPIIGGWVAFLVVLFGVGAILLAPFSRTTQESPEPVGTP